MDENITVTLIQTNIFWERASDNLEMYSDMLDTISGKTDLIILPEMFTTGFSMNAMKLAEKSGGTTMQWMKKWSGKMECIVTGSIIISDQDKFYNRLVWMRPDGSFSFYDKRHLFRMGDEHLYYNPGRSRLITEVKGWKIRPLICYDLRFPVWSKNRYFNSQWDYDILIYVANWPAARSNIWSTLLSARAIENQAFVAGVNRVGDDGNNISYSGNSLVVDLTGNILLSCDHGKTECKSIMLYRENLIENRDKLGAGRDWDQFIINI